MENRQILATFVALYVAIATIQLASTQIFDGGVPCTAETGCKDPRLPEDARCQSGFCVCLDHNGLPRNCSIRGSEARATETVNSTGRNPGLLQTCKNPQDCNLPNEVCNTTRSQCACMDGFVMASQIRKCLPVAQTLGSMCEEDQQCQKTMGNTSCIDKQCVCSFGYRFTENNTCSKILGFGERCVNDQECSHIENAVCDRQSWLCGCSGESTVNANGDKCLPVATAMFSACVEKAQCTKLFLETDCIDKRCQCLRNNRWDRGLARCVTSRGLRERCSIDYDCYQEQESENGAMQPMLCIANVCTCRGDFAVDGDKCVNREMLSGAPSSLLSGMLIALPAVVSFRAS